MIMHNHGKQLGLHNADNDDDDDDRILSLDNNID